VKDTTFVADERGEEQHTARGASIRGRQVEPLDNNTARENGGFS
jgi:hypothetical protein